jgi:hypothetical protein
MSTLLKLAENFYASNTKTCEDLADRIKSAGGDENALDELIHESAEEEKRDSEEASDVNNSGLALQVASLIEGNGLDEATKLIDGVIAGLSPKP